MYCLVDFLEMSDIWEYVVLNIESFNFKSYGKSNDFKINTSDCNMMG